MLNIIKSSQCYNSKKSRTLSEMENCEVFEEWDGSEIEGIATVESLSLEEEEDEESAPKREDDEEDGSDDEDEESSFKL